jgi:hypothetical protein
MNLPGPDTALILTTELSVSAGATAWGHGGWLPPQEREALDWTGLLRLMGWEVIVLTPEKFRETQFGAGAIKCLIVAMDPDGISEMVLSEIHSMLLNHKLLLVSRVGSAGRGIASWVHVSPSEGMAGGKVMHFRGKLGNAIWKCRNSVRLGILNFAGNLELRLVLRGKTVAGGKKIGMSRVLILGFQPSEARDQDGSMTSIIRNLLLSALPVPCAALNWGNTLVLRMDDPGSSEIIHHEIYQDCPKLTKENWKSIGDVLRSRSAQLSIGYVPGWVDDGNTRESRLQIGGHFPERKPGTVFPSPRVRYRRMGPSGLTRIYDYTEEYEALLRLRQEGLLGLAAHGFTHIHPDREAWRRSADACTNPAWYREFGSSAMSVIRELPGESHPLRRSIEWMEEYFNFRPEVLIFPGEVFTEEAVADALKHDFQLISSYYLAIRHGGRFCWIQHVCAPYLDEARCEWFDASLPVITCFHDWDISRQGIGWFAHWLEKWEEAGARDFIDLQTVKNRLDLRLSLARANGTYRLTILNCGDTRRWGMLNLELKFEAGEVPAQLEVSTQNGMSQATVTRIGPGMGLVQLTP